VAFLAGIHEVMGARLFTVVTGVSALILFAVALDRFHPVRRYRERKDASLAKAIKRLIRSGKLDGDTYDEQLGGRPR
jgi:hypothetical protein